MAKKPESPLDHMVYSLLTKPVKQLANISVACGAALIHARLQKSVLQQR